MSNTELVKDFIFKKFIIDNSTDDDDELNEDNINGCVLIYQKKDNLLLYNDKTDIMIDVCCDDYGAYIANFGDIFIEKIKERFFIVKNCYDDEIYVLKYKMNLVGLKNFSIKYDKELTKKR